MHAHMCVCVDNGRVLHVIDGFSGLCLLLLMTLLCSYLYAYHCNIHCICMSYNTYRLQKIMVLYSNIIYMQDQIQYRITL